MATETTRGLSDHVRGVTVTTLACLAGVAAAIVSAMVVGTDLAAAKNQLPLAIVGGAILVQYPLLYVLGVDVADYGIKNHLYVAFMTFALWFLTYAVALTTGFSL